MTNRIDKLELINNSREKYKEIVEPAWEKYLGFCNEYWVKYKDGEISLDECKENMENSLDVYEIIERKALDDWMEEVKGYETGGKR